MFQINNKIRYSEVDKEKRITLPAIINYFQDCSIFQSEEIGLGIEHLKARKRAWILSSWQIIVEEYLSLGDEITVGTFATGFEGLYGLRNFVMFDKSGRRVAYANSIWVLMDLELGRPIKPQPEDVAEYEVLPAIEMEFAPRRIKVPKESVTLPTFPVRKYHIDTNDHVNNCQYVQMALEVLPEPGSIRQVRVEYKQAAVYGDMILPKYTMEKDRTVVELCDVEERPFAVIELLKA